MSVISKAISDNEVTDIAAYYASMKKMRGIESGDYPFTEKLFLKGDPTRGILSCRSCHGVEGKAPGIATYPVIGGQHNTYLRVQLFHWRGGDRNNSSGGIMNKAAKALTDEEIESLSDYLSGL